MHSAGSGRRSGEHHCGSGAAWKPRAPAFLGSPWICSVNPSSVAHGTGIHSWGECLVLRERLAIFYCCAQGGMSVPFFVPPALLQECCTPGKAQEAMATLPCPATTRGDGIQRGVRFFGYMISVCVSLKDVTSSTGGRISDQESF